MRLCELPSVQRWLPISSTAADPLWQRELGSVTEMELQLFYTRAKLDGRKQDAIDAIGALQANVILASFKGEIAPPGPLIMHEPPADPYFVDELVDSLVKLRPARRKACLFALESSSSPSDVVTLQWQQALQMKQLTPLCREILEVTGRTRHMKLPYVFWEWATPKIAAPLLELQWSVEKAFDCTWPELVLRYRSMVQLNRGADAVSLLDLASHR